MAVTQEIDKLENEFAAAIKRAEAQKKGIMSINADVAKASKDIGAEVKSLIDRLTFALRELDEWEARYDRWIADCKESAKDFPAYKKKNAEATRFYEQLTEEKKEKDAARKKAGKNYKPSKEDLIFDAVYKKASTAYEDSTIVDLLERTMKSVDRELEYFEESYKNLTKEAKEAMEQFDDMTNGLKKSHWEITSYGGRSAFTFSSVLSREFGRYFGYFEKK